MPNDVQPNRANDIGMGGPYDVSAYAGIGNRIVFALNETLRSLAIETFADRNGNLAGFVDIYLGDEIGAVPWRTLAMGGYRVSPIPAVRYITLVPRTGAQGFIALVATSENLGFSVGAP